MYACACCRSIYPICPAGCDSSPAGLPAHEAAPGLRQICPLCFLQPSGRAEAWDLPSIPMPRAELAGHSSLTRAAPPIAEESGVSVGQTALKPPWQHWGQGQLAAWGKVSAPRYKVFPVAWSTHWLQGMLLPGSTVLPCEPLSPGSSLPAAWGLQRDTVGDALQPRQVRR